MANTYTLIKGETLASSAASYTFSAIPSTYTDLVVRASARSTFSANGFSLRTTFNGDTASNYSYTEIYVTGTSVGAGQIANYSRADFYATDGNLDTADTFGTAEFYIPSYTVSQNKPMGGYGMSELNSASNNVIGVTAALWRNTSAITSINIATLGNFVAGSSFYLYGIKNT